MLEVISCTKPPYEVEALLDRILENTSFTEALLANDAPNIEEVSWVESPPLLLTNLDTTSKPSPEPTTSEEEEIIHVDPPLTSRMICSKTSKTSRYIPCRRDL